MRKLKQILVAILLGTMISAGVFAQKGNDNRPPKEPQRVKEKEKPPPSNRNQNSNKRDKP
ncbi:MAG: hypothetical protein QOE96_1046 [Blastocatellia bacterium]|jgi:hypothetical protein|nr:hypothetical protein [Blastocatellia bacterium]